MGKRIILFVLTNVLVLLTITLVSSIFGIQPYLSEQGINYTSLMIFCLMWGMGGAFISLALSRVMAKWTMGVQVIDPNTTDPYQRNLLERVHALARRANIDKMPQVGYYDSPEINAFATGPTKNRSLVAVSTGLLNSMREHEVDGVLAHEVAHIANGDMVTMTLVQGVVNAFVMFIARIIAFFVARFAPEELEWMVRFAVTIALEIALSFLGMIVVATFSRWREFRADEGGARLGGKDKMIGALQALQRTVESVDTSHGAAMSTMKISGGSGGLMALFSTHPPLDQRIARLQGRSIA